MSSLRNAVIVAFVTASTVTLTAQQDACTHLTIVVTDTTGAPIPKAKVEVMSPEEGKLLTFTANSEGIAEFHLRPGDYQYRIAYPAFCPRNGITTIDPIGPQEIRARLEVDSCPGPCAPPCVTPAEVVPSGYPVTIKVIEPAGGPVSGALVEIDPSLPSSRIIKTDGKGQAVLGLPTGTHSLRVSAFGFRRWNGFAEVRGTREVITAKLRAATMVNPGVSIEPPGVDVPLHLQELELKLIALEPLETLPLPGVTVRKHNRRH